MELDKIIPLQETRLQCLFCDFDGFTPSAFSLSCPAEKF